VIGMEKLTIVVGRDMLDDLKGLAKNPMANKNKYPKNAIYVKTPQQAMYWVTVEKLRLIQKMLSYRPDLTVSKLAELTNRKQEAVSRDLSELQLIGAIKKHKKGRKVFLEPKIDSIEIRFK